MPFGAQHFSRSPPHCPPRGYAPGGCSLTSPERRTALVKNGQMPGGCQKSPANCNFSIKPMPARTGAGPVPPKHNAKTQNFALIS